MSKILSATNSLFMLFMKSSKFKSYGQKYRTPLERMRARANACNVNEIRKALDEKEKQVASMLTERDMQQDELVRVSAQILGNFLYSSYFITIRIRMISPISYK